jgi:hypothetical protein
MPTGKKPRQISGAGLDNVFKKKSRGRPGVSPSQVMLRAQNYRRMFWTYRLRGRKNDKQQVRDRPYEWAAALVAAKTADDVMRALDSSPSHIQNQFRPLTSLILQVLKERVFPKRQENQFDFLADSLAARGDVGPRRSRDICQAARSEERRAHHIIRYEFKIECSCGFKGFSRDHACPKCGANIQLGIGSFSGPSLF